MAAKLSELAKLLKKIEKQCDKYADDNWDCDCPFDNLDEYEAYIAKQLKLTKKSKVYVYDLDDDTYSDEMYENLMSYQGQDVNIQINQTYVTMCDGDYELIVMVVTKN